MAQKHWSVEEKLEIVLTGLKGDMSVAQLCRKHGVSEATYYKWRSQFLEGGKQALVQVLQPIFEPAFSESSYGFRPNRSAHQAIRKAREYYEQGYTYAVDLDLAKYFDTVVNAQIV